MNPDATIAREEIFGLVLALVRAKDLDHAIELVNRSAFGNASSLFTDRAADAKRFRHRVEAGNLAVNAGTAAPMPFFHFGGWKTRSSATSSPRARTASTSTRIRPSTTSVGRTPDRVGTTPGRSLPAGNRAVIDSVGEFRPRRFTPRDKTLSNHTRTETPRHVNLFRHQSRGTHANHGMSSPAARSRVPLGRRTLMLDQS